ncbi:hypothetical protein, partial [Neisseria sicca]|uniref:hypothetical protein n=1 Tax=Neisseria sicca TaxID=490 RepID=UPI001C9A1D64
MENVKFGGLDLDGGKREEMRIVMRNEMLGGGLEKELGIGREVLLVESMQDGMTGRVGKGAR